MFEKQLCFKDSAEDTLTDIKFARNVGPRDIEIEL